MSKNMSTEEILEQNKRDALRLAKDIYSVVIEPEFIKLDYEVRMRTVQSKVPEFCKAYPSVVRWMVRDLKYNEKAFIDYLDMLEREHYSDKKVEQGKGYLEYIRKQAEYARMLYKRSVPHFDAKIAASIFKTEYDAMLKTYKEMKAEEEEYRNEYEEEKADHKVQKIKELVNFIKSSGPMSPEGAIRGEINEEVFGKLKNVAEIIQYRMQQAAELEKNGGDIPGLVTEPQHVDFEGKEEIVIQEPDNPTPEELARRLQRTVEQPVEPAPENKSREESFLQSTIVNKPTTRRRRYKGKK